MLKVMLSCMYGTFLTFCTHFLGGILAGFISDKTNCSGITVVVMLFLAGPMVSALLCSQLAKLNRKTCSEVLLLV